VSRRGTLRRRAHDTLINESKWQTVRHGLEARVFTADPGPVRQAVARTLERIRPHADDLGASEYLAGIERIVAEGNSAERQLDVFADDHEVAAVVAAIAAESAVLQPVSA
jgi:carboxylate-amine ligase